MLACILYSAIYKTDSILFIVEQNLRTKDKGYTLCC